MISTPSRSARSRNCSIAAARKVSAATRSGWPPAAFARAASFAAEVVFPAPLTPTRRITSISASVDAERSTSSCINRISAVRSRAWPSPSRSSCASAMIARAVAVPASLRINASSSALQSGSGASERRSAWMMPPADGAVAALMLLCSSFVDLRQKASFNGSPRAPHAQHGRRRRSSSPHQVGDQRRGSPHPRQR